MEGQNKLDLPWTDFEKSNSKLLILQEQYEQLINLRKKYN